MKKIAVLLCFVLLMVGCFQYIKLLNNYENVKTAIKETEQIQVGEIQELVNENKKLTNKIEVMKEQHTIITNNINKQLITARDSLKLSFFNVFQEKLFIDSSDILFSDSMNIQAVKALLGEPIEIVEYVEAHGSGMVLELTYNEASFTFNKDGEEETIKWYSVNTPFFMTNRGISVGSTRDEVKAQYGNNYMMYSENNEQISIGEKTGISFEFKEDLVSEISVWFMYE